MTTATDSNNDNTMLAFVVEGNSGRVVSIPKPSPPPGFALVKVLRAGVCNTDLEILQGYMGFKGVLGHEFVGTVVEVNDTDETSWLGQRVCGDINVGCASCGVCFDSFDLNKFCPQMSRNHCPTRTVLGILNKDGTMAEYLTLPLSNLHKVPAALTNEQAVFAEPLAAACRIVEQGLIQYIVENDQQKPDKVAILGDGKLGLMIAEVLGREHAKHFGKATEQEEENNKQRPPQPILFGKHAHKLQLVQEAGVTTAMVADVIDASSFTGVTAAHSHQYDVVIDATGSPQGLKLAAGLTRPMGTLCLKSTCASGAEQFNAAPFVIDELRVIGSRCGPIDTALKLLAIGVDDESDDSSSNAYSQLPPLKVEKYVTKTFPLAQAEEAIQCAAEKSTMKVQIICSEEETRQ